MIAATNHDQQGAAQRSGGGARKRHGDAAPSVVDHKFHGSSRPCVRCEKPRANCRGHRASALSFTPRAVTLDEILELRLCDLTGRHAVINRSRLDTLGNQPPTKIADASTHFPARLSSTAFDGTEPIESEGQERGRFIQGRGGLIQELGAAGD